MAKIGLSFYSLKVKVPYLHNGKEIYKYVKLGNNEHFNISDCVYNYLRNKSKQYHDDKSNEKIYKPTYIETNSYYVKDAYLLSSIKSIIKSGNYGVEMDIVDSEKNITVYNQKKQQAGVLPFGFSVYFSEGIETAVLAIQTFGSKGMSSKIKEIIDQAIKKYDSKYVTEIKTIQPNIYFKRLMEEEKIKSICLETYKKPKTIDGDSEIKSQCLVDYSEKEVKYKKPLLNDKNKIYEYFINRKSLKSISGLTSDEEEITNMKIEFLVNGQPKTVNYNTYFNLMITEDITEDVVISKNTGHPNRKSLFEEMLRYALTYLQMLNIIYRLEDDVDIDVRWEKMLDTRKINNDGEEIIEKINDKTLSFSC